MSKDNQQQNNNGINGSNNQPKTEKKTVYLFAFRCKACNAQLNPSGSSSVKEFYVGDTRYLEENNYCSKCVSGSLGFSNYEPDYAHSHLCEGNFNSSGFSDDY